MGVLLRVSVLVFLVSVYFSAGESKKPNIDECHNGNGGSCVGGSGSGGGGSGGSAGSGGGSIGIGGIGGQCPTIDLLLKTCCKSGKDGRDGRDGRNGQKGDKGDKGDRGLPGSSGKCNCSVKQQDIDALQQKYDLLEQSFNAKIRGLMKLKLNGTSTIGFFELVREIIGHAASLEAFKRKGTQYLILTKSSSYPSVYVITTKSTLHLHHRLSVYGAYTIRHFEMNGEHFLAIAKRRHRRSYMMSSAIHKWEGERLYVFQRFNTQGAGEMTYFTIQDQKFLCIANSYDGKTYSVDSLIYKWNGQAFVHYQHLKTEGAIACSAFSIGRENFLSFASISPFSDSVIFKWSGKSFIKLQEILTERAVKVHHFSTQSLHFLAFIDQTRYFPYSKVVILRWSNSKFVPFQTVSISGAVSLSSFKVSNGVFLVVANSPPSSRSGNGCVAIYRGDGYKFRFYQKFGYVKASDVATFGDEDKTYFVVVSRSFSVNGQLYKWVSN